MRVNSSKLRIIKLIVDLYIFFVNKIFIFRIATEKLHFMRDIILFKYFFMFHYQIAGNNQLRLLVFISLRKINIYEIAKTS